MMRTPIIFVISFTGWLLFCPVNTAGQNNKYTNKHDSSWPVLKCYDQKHTLNIALPLGGIGTGTLSISGRGSLEDWEIMNVPAKGYIPGASNRKPFFALYVKPKNGPGKASVLEGTIPITQFEGSHGSPVANPGFPRFRNYSFETAYPLAQVNLSDPEIPVNVKIKAFNPLIPGDEDKSGIPIAVLQTGNILAKVMG